MLDATLSFAKICRSRITRSRREGTKYIMFKLCLVHPTQDGPLLPRFIQGQEPRLRFLLSVFVYICPPHCERNSAHIVRTFPSSFRCVFDIVAHNVAGKSKILQYVGVRSFSQFLIIFIVHSIQFFIVSSKISKFLKLDQN